MFSNVDGDAKIQLSMLWHRNMLVQQDVDGQSVALSVSVC